MVQGPASSAFASLLAVVEDSDGATRYSDAQNPLRTFRAESPSASPPGSYVVVRLLDGETAAEVHLVAAPNTALHEVYTLFVGAGLSPCFPNAVQAEVEQWQRAPGIFSPDLSDLESLPFVTIDGEHSRDLDQALFVDERPGGFVVFYALADASYYVRAGTALFTEALSRGSSYYLPGAMIPMLPPALSEGLVSLNPSVARRALVFEMHLDPQGVVETTRVLRARIRSRAKLSFQQVQRFYDEPKQSPLAGESFAASLERLRVVGELRRARAQEKNVVRYRRVEVEAQLPYRETRRFVVTEAIRHPVEAYNEQLSLLCNTEGARLLEAASGTPLIEPIFRVHPQPSPAAYEGFRSLTCSLAQLHGLSRSWVWEPTVSLAEYLAQLPETPASVAAAIHRQAVMLNVGSSFDANPSSHFGVGASVYARFSAPMREIVGVFLHRELTQVIERRPTDDEALRAAVVDRANRCRQLQKSLTNASNLLVLDQLFRDRLGETTPPLTATIVGITPSKLHVRFDAPPVDAKISVADVSAHWKQALTVAKDGSGVYFNGSLRLRLGDRVSVLVLSHDERRRHWRLSIDENTLPNFV